MAALVVWLAVMAVRIFPVWYEYRIVRTTLASLGESGELRRPNAASVQELLRARLTVSYVQPAVLDDITLERAGDVYEVHFKYERVVPLAGNVSLLFRFAGGTGSNR